MKDGKGMQWHRRWASGKSPLPPWWGACAVPQWHQSKGTPHLWFWGRATGDLSGNEGKIEKQSAAWILFHAAMLWKARTKAACCLSNKAMSPLEAAATRAIPTTMVHHGGRAQAGVPGLCTPSEPPLPLPQSFPASLSPGTPASRLEMYWGKGGGAGQRDSRVFSLSSHLKKCLQTVC